MIKKPAISYNKENSQFIRECRMLASGRCCNSIKCDIEFNVKIQLIKNMREQLKHLKAKEKRDFVRESLRSCCLFQQYDSERQSATMKRGKMKIEYKIDGVLICRETFQMAFNVGSSYIDYRLQEIKKNIVNSESLMGNLSPSELSASCLKDILTRHVDPADCSLPLSREQISLAYLINSEPNYVTHVWMESHFDMMGDDMGNTEGQIHLDPVTKKTIYKEYCEDMEDSGDVVLAFSTFKNLWYTCFPHVKIREYKAVNGKCATCAILTLVRRMKRSPILRALVTELHFCHKCAFCGERAVYYKKRSRAKLDPQNFMSTIADGMATFHTEIPHTGNLSAFAPKLPHKVMGIIQHGRSLTLLRMFHNIAGGSNAAVHCWLLELEERFLADGKLPDVIDHQNDGGSEFANQLFYVISELIVAKRLCLQVTISRLITGHTHEDIDGVFGFIWTAIRNMQLITPDKFESAMAAAVAGKESVQSIKDVFVVPDYKKYLKGSYASIRNYAKEEWTQHVWKFVAVPVDENFPLGVKVTYRAYAAEQTLEIYECPEQRDIPYRVRNVKNVDHPQATDCRPYAGAHMLERFPTVEIEPAPFVQGSKQELDAVYSKVQQQYGNCNEVISSWDKWMAEKAPFSDDVLEYVVDHPMHVPFKDILFNSDYVVDYSRHYSSGIVSSTLRDKIDFVAGPSVIFDNAACQCCAGGIKRKHQNPVRLPLELGDDGNYKVDIQGGVEHLNDLKVKRKRPKPKANKKDPGGWCKAKLVQELKALELDTKGKKDELLERYLANVPQAEEEDN